MLVLIILFYLASRFVGLMHLPVFNDEALYLALVLRLVNDPGKNLFVGFADGKEPVFFWVWTLFWKFIREPLAAGRMVSVVAGLGTLVVFYFLSLKVLTKRGALVAALMLTVSPFVLWYDRLAIVDSLLFFWLTLCVYALYSRKMVLFGVAAGLALLTKTTSVIFLVSFWPLYLRVGWRKLILPLVIVLGIYALLVVQPDYQAIFKKDATFVTGQFRSVFWANFKQSVRWVVGYQGWPFILTATFGGLIVIREKFERTLPWVAMVIIPVVIESAIAKIYFPRYILFTIIPMVILVVLAIEKLPKVILFAALSVIILPGLLIDGQIISGSSQVGFPFIERWQYISGWPSGYGLAEAANYLRQRGIRQVSTEPIAILEYGLPYYSNGRIEVVPASSIYVTSQQQTVLDKKIVAEFPRPGGEKVRIYQ